MNENPILFNMKNKDTYGKCIFSQKSFQEFQEYHIGLNRSWLIAFVVGVFIIVFLLVVGFLEGMNFGYLLIVFTILTIILAVLIIFYIIKITENWFGIFERGISPAILPIKYALNKKKFILYSEIDTINIEKDDNNNNIHKWRFKILLKDGNSFVISYQNGEEAYPIIKYIMKHLKENDYFTEKEIKN